MMTPKQKRRKATKRGGELSPAPKEPKPTIPKCAPPGTVWYGGPIDWFDITLRITGDDLDPKEVSKLLGREPDFSHCKGEPILKPDRTVARVAKTGAWHLNISAKDTHEWDCAEAIMLLMKLLPSGLEIWNDLNRRFSMDIFVGLSMRSRNKGFSLPPEVMLYLGEREIEVGFDIYCDEKEEH